MTRTIPWRPWSGLFAGAGAWAASSQAGYSLAPVSCGSPTNIVPLVTAAAIVTVAAGLWLSWSGLRLARRNGQSTLKFAAILSLLAGALFAFAILLQGASAFVFTGCEH